MDWCFGNNGGYNWGAGMSNRAVRAYEYGAKPKSKWTKQNIIEEVLSNTDLFSEDALNKLSKKQLFDTFLEYDSWHHTSSAFNETSFYAIRSDLEDITLPDPQKREVHSKVKEPNYYVTALVSYKTSERTRRSWKTVWVHEVVHYMSQDKMVVTKNGNKRRSSLVVYKKIEQKTKYADDKRVKEIKE